MKHDFTFTRWANDPILYGSKQFILLDPPRVALYACTHCGTKADSKTLYVMDREECNARSVKN